MRTLRTISILPLMLVLFGCGGAVAPRGDSQARVDPSALPEADADEPADPATPAGPRIWASAPWQELELSPGAAALERGARSVTDGRWKDARKELEDALESMGPSAPIDERLAGLALLGRACAALHDEKAAEQAYATVIGSWKGREAARELLTADSNEATGNLRLQRALLAVGEALYFVGEQKRALAARLAMPGYAGDRDAKSVNAFIDKDVAAWVAKKRVLVDEAQDSYLAITAMEPVAPPRLAVRASARVATLWGHFTAQFRAAPIPRDWLRTGEVPGENGKTWSEVRAAYYAALDEASKPERAQARAAYLSCQKTAAQLGIADEFSRSCDQWLANTR